jgi:hypothetical protein
MGSSVFVVFPCIVICGLKTVDLSKNVLLHKLYELGQLKGMYLVTGVFSCGMVLLSIPCA